MQVVATAGHVDHGKSTLVRALTGMEPDRWAEERRRGLTIDLGFAWMTLPDGGRLAFVDVPGHERFVPNMLAGVGPVPAVLLVVAADEGWMPQTAEHLAAVDALGIQHGLLVVTRSDLADPEAALRQAAEETGATRLGALDAVPVSAVTGAGMPELRAALARLAGRLGVPDPAAPVRLWVDRAFSITGSGTVVTGTLPAGALRSGDELLVTPSMRPVRVRALQSLGEPAGQVVGVARVAVNLRGTALAGLARGMALVTPGRWTMTNMIDVRLTGSPPAARELTLHIGSARTQVRIRRLGGVIARLTLREPLPLHVGDQVLLRDPGAARSARTAPLMLGARVLDPVPPALVRRGAAAAVADELAGWPEVPAAGDLLRRHRLLHASVLATMGIEERPVPVVAEWLADPAHWAGLRERLADAVSAYAAREPLAPGMPVDAARAALGLPDRHLVGALAAAPLEVRGGYVFVGAGQGGHSSSPGGAPGPPWPDTPRGTGLGGRGSPQGGIPEPVVAAAAKLRGDLAAAPFLAPDADRLRELGLDLKAVAAAARAGLLLRISEQIVLAPGAAAEAARVLARLPQPFTAAEARQALHTTRRVAIPLLEYLDRAGVTERLADDRRRMR